MRTACSRLAWGLALEMIDFRIQFFDLLPDALGFLLILMGLSYFRQDGRVAVNIGAAAAGILLVLSLPRLLMNTAVNLSDLSQVSYYDLLWYGIQLALELVMLYGICEAISGRALARGSSELVDQARITWRFLFWLGLICLLLMSFLVNMSNGTLWQILLSFVLFVTELIMMLSLVRKAGRELGRPIGDVAAEEDS